MGLLVWLIISILFILSYYFKIKYIESILAESKPNSNNYKILTITLFSVGILIISFLLVELLFLNQFRF
jgi:ABC-type Na+ efflux pump permease subunit